MLTGNFKRHDAHIYKGQEGIDILKTAAIYGANGSGKSNLVKAISYLQQLVLEGTNKVNQSIIIPAFKLDKISESDSTSFEIEFKRKGVAYSYGISIHNSEIIDEWLYLISAKKEDEMIFEREVKNGKNKLNFHPKYLAGQKAEMLKEIYEEDILRKNQPFITQVFGKNFEEINEAYNWFEENLNVVFPSTKYMALIAHLSLDEKFRAFTSKILNQVKTGVSDIETQEVDFEDLIKEKELKEKIPALEEGKGIAFEYKGDMYSVFKPIDSEPIAKRLVLKHPGINDEYYDFKFTEESDGTQRLFDLIPGVYSVFKSENVVIIDEMDRSMHPSISKGLLDFFLANADTKGQIVFTTHESNLLDLKLLRQDEIWFTEKNRSGETKIYSLSEYKPRYDLDIQKGYLKGRFGAVPFVGDLKKLNWEEDAEA